VFKEAILNCLLIHILALLMYIGHFVIFSILIGSVCSLFLDLFLWIYNFFGYESRISGKRRNLQLINLRNLSWMRLHLH